MDTERRKLRFPGVGWLSAKLTRKMIFILVAAAVLGWLLSISWFLSYLGRFVGESYDQVLEEARDEAGQVASFLEGSQGGFEGLEEYLEERELGCAVRDEAGEVLFRFMPREWGDAQITVPCRTDLTLRSGERLSIYVESAPLSRQDLSELVAKKAFAGLLLFNLTLLLLAGLLLYLLIVSPIVRLRRTMREYSEKGTLPPRSDRMDEVGKLQNTFADLTGVLRAKEQSERRLIASISHDIKTPLTSVLGCSERLLSAQLTPEKEERYLQSIHDKGLAIKSIVDEFDDYLDAGLRDGAPMELISVQALCDGLVREYREELEDTGVSLTVRCTCPNAELICNWAHMRRYFGNLIGNSIQHSGAEKLRLEVLVRQEGREVVLEFGDNGTGVPEELLQQIFEPLYTSDRGRKVSGLGLAICRSIIRAHGGTMSAENRPQGGLVVRAVLPCAGGERS